MRAGGRPPGPGGLAGLAVADPDLSQVSDSMGPLNQCPRGQLIRALSSGPSVDPIV